MNIGFDGKNVLLISYLKGFSIFTVSLMHLVTMMSAMPSSIITLSAIGGTGVHTFFLCSGIGLYMSYLRNEVGYMEFVKKRFLKIYIPYIIIIILSFFIPWMYKGEDRLLALLSHVFFFKMFLPQFEESFGTQFWFISTIFQLYLVFIPMCVIKSKMKNYLFVSVFAIISICWWLFCFILGVGNVRIWGSFFLQYIWEFALGFVVADVIYLRKTISINWKILFVGAVIGIGMQAGLATVSETLKLFNDIPGLIGYTSLALLLSNIKVIKRFFVILSQISYELFLIHILVFISMFRLFNPNGIIMQLFIGILSMSIAIILSYLYKKILDMHVYRIK